MTTTMISKRHIAEMPFAPERLREIKDKMLSWASRFGISLFLDSNDYADKHGQYECLLAAGAAQLITAENGQAFTKLQRAHDEQKDWLFGHFCYDLKNVLEPHLESRHVAKHDWPAIQFFVPEVVCLVERGSTVLKIQSLSNDAAAIGAEIMSQGNRDAGVLPKLSFQSCFSKEEYLQRIVALREHIRNGDCYEITFCNEAHVEDVVLYAQDVFCELNQASPAPFAAFYQNDGKYMMCASPERFINKRSRKLLSQPIKGTVRRSLDTAEDERLKEELRNSEKEQAENVMIVDLVRNDLARSCEVSSIEVEELFGIYSFPRVHQMISAVSGALRNGVPFMDAIRHAFPMGSMTGAPKHKVMQLIDKYEEARRELFSGSVGYISPDGDFDFNVVIRSLFYNADAQYLSYQTGGAITWGSDAESEWEELRLKARTMERIFSGENL